MNISPPKIIELSKLGNDEIGFISVIEKSKSIPFDVKRVYWTYNVPANTKRGMHAHKLLQQIIIAITGKLKFVLEDKKGNTSEFILDTPSKALYIPSGFWRDIYFSETSTLLSLASLEYTEDDYIRDYDFFKSGKW